MGLTLTKGSEAMFVELEQNDVVKRFVLPQIEGLQGKLQSLMRKYPNLLLVRFGKAIVASEDGTSNLRDGLEDVPSAVVSSCMVDLCGAHPILNVGPARYSLELVKAINECEVETVVQEEIPSSQASVYDFVSNGNGTDAVQSSDTGTVAAPKADLAASLRAQMEQQKEPSKAETLQEKLNAQLAQQKSKPVAEKSELILVTQNDLESVKAINKDKPKTDNEKMTEAYFANHKKAEIVVREGRPASKIDLIIEKLGYLESILVGDDAIPEGEVTWEELQSWFWSHYDTIGAEKTFRILASRLTR